MYFQILNKKYASQSEICGNLQLASYMFTENIYFFIITNYKLCVKLI